MTTASYSRLRITGPISIEPLATIEDADTSFMVLLMGPTGVGKSTFVENVGNRADMGISRDQLEGYTDQVQAYRLVNVVYGHGGSAINLIDTPGFLDRKIPETRALAMMRQWMNQSKVDRVDRIIYFHRITDTRVAGSARKLLKLFRGLTGESTGSDITFATTMWDSLWTVSQIERANDRLQELKASHLEVFVEEGAIVTKFENSHESALGILNHALSAEAPERFRFDAYLEGKLSFGRASFGPLLYENLIQRRSSVQQRLQAIKDSSNARYDIGVQDGQILEGLLLSEEAEAMDDLRIVDEEIENFGPLFTMHNRLKVMGDITAVPIERVEDVDITFIILLVGPTGAGKSTFIERLCDKTDLQISGDMLDGVTQDVKVYRLSNLVYGHGDSPIVIIDTPGLLECGVPETKTFKQIQEWMKKWNIESIHRIIYFHRITDNRMTESALNAINMFRGITGGTPGSNTVIAITMWDRLSNTFRHSKEDKRFEQLRDTYFEAFAKGGSPVVKFENDQHSALTILNETLMPGIGQTFNIEKYSEHMSTQKAEVMKLKQVLYSVLTSRLNSVMQRLRFAEEGSVGRVEVDAETVAKCKTYIVQLEREIEEIKFVEGSEAGSRVSSQAPIKPNAIIRSFEDKPLPPLPIAHSRSEPLTRIQESDITLQSVGKLEQSAQLMRRIFNRKR